MVSKKECLEALSDIENDLCELEEHRKGVAVSCLYNESLDKLNQLINEHFDNQPLKFEQINTGKPVFDNEDHGWIVVAYIDMLRKRIRYIDVDGLCGWIEFEENRFYRKQVEE